MASKSPQNEDVQRSSGSSLLSPLSLRSRRNSAASIVAQMDKESVAQALDQIHTSASRSESLTTFNDFTSPPMSTSEKDERSLASQLPQASGLGSIYTRLKASVAGTKDSSSSLPPRPKTAENSGDVPAKASSQKPSPLSVKASDPTAQASLATVTPVTPRTPRSSKSTLDDTESQQDHSASEGRTGPNNPDILRSTSEPLVPLTQTSNKGGKDVAATPRATATQLSRVPSGDLKDLSNVSSLPVDEGQAKSSDARDLSGVRDVAPNTSNAARIVETRQPHSPIDSARSTPSHQDSHLKASKLRVNIPHPPSTGNRSGLGSERGSSSIISDGPGSSYDNASAKSKSKTTQQPLHSNSLIYQMQRKVLSRDFWMKDENAKVCFRCGESFSTFRRKHHCRLCGQIYCNSCTNLISGKPFGQASKLRVCRTCEAMLNDEDSSDCSEDEEPAAAPMAKQIRFSDTIKTGGGSPATSNRDKRLDEDKSPHHPGGSLSSRKPRELRRTLTSGIDPVRQPALARPSSSRSLKSLSGRPRSSSHKSLRPRSQHTRSLSFMSNEAPPFHKASHGGEKAEKSLPAFHSDSIIDPDLAPFLSDDESSDDGYSSISAALEPESHDQSTGGFNGVLGALRRGRPRTPGKSLLEHSLAERDADNISIAASKTGHARRHLGNRTFSIGSVANYGSSPRVIKSDNLLRSSDNLYAMLNRFNSPERGRESKREEFEPWKASNKKSNGRAGVAELNSASLDHVKRLLTQFLRDANIQHTKRWERALIPILLRCAEEVDPSIHRGDDIDIRHYVKLKKAPGGSPSDSRYVSGIVFSKNVALKDMSRTIRNPKILLVSFPLIYARHQQHFMSLEGVIAQEREYLKNLSNRIIALRPNLLLVQGQVAGDVTRFLGDAAITVIFNVKSSTLHAASRCTQTRIVSSVDKLTMDPRGLGTCERFDVKTHVYQQAKISHVYLSGCQEDLGCTIVLRGADTKTLSKMKWITEFMCYVTYNLKLETCLMRDQFVSLPSSNQGLHSSFSHVDEQDEKGLVEKPNSENNSNPIRQEVKKLHDNSLIDHSGLLSPTGPPLGKLQGSSVEKFDAFGSYDSTVRQLKQRLLSVSPFVSLAEPYLLRRGQEQEIHMAQLRILQQSQDSEAPKEHDNAERPDSQKFELVRPEMVYSAEQNTSPHVREILHAVHNAEYEKASQNYAAIRRRWEMYIAGVSEPYSPLSHQKIVALFSIISSKSGDSCVGPDLLGLDFYQEHDIEEGCERDMPLGEYVERLCDQVESPCITGNCECDMIEHHRQYVHGEGQVSVSIQKCASRYRNMQNTIMMWSCCRICDQETQVVPMSGDSWKYSFAKYLELSFWSNPLHPRAGTCPHDIHREHLRYFGFKNLAIRIQYDPINLVEVTVPRGTITWAVDKDLRLKNEQYQRFEERMKRFLSSVRLRLKEIKLSSIEVDKREDCNAEIEELLKRVREQSDGLATDLQQQYTSAKFYEIVPLNRVLRRLQEEVVEWDTTFANFERNYFPSEKDLRKLAATQLRKVYLDQDEPMSMNLDEETTLNEKAEEGADAKSFDTSKDIDSPRSSLEGQRHTPLDAGVGQRTAPLEESNASSIDEHAISRISPKDAQVVQTLDLAVPEVVVETSAPAWPDRTISEAQSDTIRIVGDLPPLGASIAGEMRAPGPRLGQADGQRQSESKSGGSEHPTLRPARASIVPALIRANTQPSIHTRVPSNEMTGQIEDATGMGRTEPPLSQLPSASSKIPVVKSFKSPEKPSVSALKIGRSAMQSMIPRAISGRRNHNRVSALAKHFEEMSREFEKERIRERLQRAARTRQSRAFPLASAKPIVEVFRDASEAVREREPSYEELGDAPIRLTSRATSNQDLRKFQDYQPAESRTNEGQEEHVDYDKIEAEQSEENTMIASYPASEIEGAMSDTEAGSNLTSGSVLGDAVDGPLTSPTGIQEYPIEIAKDEKSTLMKMLTSFWSERSASGWSPLEYPLVATAHIFADSDLIVREDEPSSLIAFTLASHDYKGKIQRFWERAKAAEQDKSLPKIETPAGSEDNDVERIMLGTTATHMRYQFQSGTARMQCKVFYAESFDAIRRKCGVSDRFVESLSRCLKWDSKGGKTKSLFLKTLDERFVLKSLSPVETQAFLKFAPDYFDYMSKCLFHNLPSALAKMLGFYQVVIKNPVTGNEYNWFLQVMENVFYEGPSNRMFDLKGSMRNRKVQSTGQKDEVLLDENLLDYISQSPVYVRNHSNTVLASSIQNDTLFCSKQNVMDYSLIVGLYDDRKELLVGIIDYIRTYTWDKKLESWIKDRGKHKATVRSPKEYRTRFRRSIPRYFPLAPSCWQVFGVRRIEDARARVEEMDAEDVDDDDDALLEVASISEGV